MSAMLGEMLVKVGALTKAQLEQVLNAQAIYGGRLGTNLVEMGFLAEDDLARVLKEKLGVPCVDAATVNSVPENVLAAVPVDLVRRYHVLPVALSGKKLTLAMADPSDYRAIDEIGFVTGLVIVAKVCTELRLNMALERYYGIKRRVRYIPVAGGFSSRFTAAAGSIGEAPAGKAEAALAHGDAEAGDAPPLADGALQRLTDGSTEGVAAGKHAGPASTAEDAGTGGPARVHPATVNDLADRLATAATELDVVSALLAYLGAEFDRGAFLTVKRGMVLGVQAVCAGCQLADFGRFSLPLDEARLLAQVVKERRLYIGELETDGADGQLLRAMGGEATSPALLVPLSIDGQVAALVCANDLKGRLAGGLFDLQRVAAMAELTFEMICLRKRIKNC